MSRTAPRKGTNVQAEAPAVEAVTPTAAAPAAPPADVPRLGPGWKLALIVWALGFVGLGLFEVIGMVYKLLFR